MNLREKKNELYSKIKRFPFCIFIGRKKDDLQ